MPVSGIEKLHKDRMLRLRQLQKELTLQNRAFVEWTFRPKDSARIWKWRTQRKLVEQARIRFQEAQEAYLEAVLGKNAALR